MIGYRRILLSPTEKPRRFQRIERHAQPIPDRYKDWHKAWSEKMDRKSRLN